MQKLDLVIKNGTVATSADIISCDIGITGGRVIALGENLEGESEIDASGKIVMPGGIDSHLHLDQPTGDGSVMADDFYTGTVSAEGKAVIDYAFPLIVTDTTER